MVAVSIEDVRKAFDGKPALAVDFAQDFMAAYAGAAFGVLPKTEIDLLVFSLLIKAKVINADGPIYRTARALNITPAKARTLLFQHQLRNVSEAETDHAVMIAITTARYRKEGDNLAFGVASPLVKAAIAAKMQDGGVFADISLSGEILKVDPTQFGAVISSLVSAAQAQALIARLKKRKIVDEGELRKALNEVGTKLAKDVVDKGLEKGLDPFLEGLGSLVHEHADQALDVLAHLVDAL